MFKFALVSVNSNLYNEIHSPISSLVWPTINAEDECHHLNVEKFVIKATLEAIISETDNKN